MKKHQKTIITVLLAVLLLAWMGRSYIRNLFPPKMNIYTASLVSVDDNKPMTLHDYKEKVIIVSCYQTWCTDCARETPVLNQLAASIASPNFKIIYVSDEDATAVTAFRQRFSSANILFARYLQPMSAAGISVFPTTFLLDKNGEVIKTKLEGYNWMKEEAAIRKIMAD